MERDGLGKNSQESKRFLQKLESKKLEIKKWKLIDKLVNKVSVVIYIVLGFIIFMTLWLRGI